MQKWLGMLKCQIKWTAGACGFCGVATHPTRICSFFSKDSAFWMTLTMTCCSRSLSGAGLRNCCRLLVFTDQPDFSLPTHTHIHDTAVSGQTINALVSSTTVRNTSLGDVRHHRPHRPVRWVGLGYLALIMGYLAWLISFTSVCKNTHRTRFTDFAEFSPKKRVDLTIL